jgi:hypothetical protein
MTDHLGTSLADLLRQTVLLGAARPLSLDAPLGASGIGLDSLGVAEFLSAVEDRHGVELPRWIWSDAGRLTLRGLATEVQAVQ